MHIYERILMYLICNDTRHKIARDHHKIPPETLGAPMGKTSRSFIADPKDFRSGTNINHTALLKRIMKGGHLGGGTVEVTQNDERGSRSEEMDFIKNSLQESGGPTSSLRIRVPTSPAIRVETVNLHFVKLDKHILHPARLRKTGK